MYTYGQKKSGCERGYSPVNMDTGHPPFVDQSLDGNGWCGLQ